MMVLIIIANQFVVIW